MHRALVVIDVQNDYFPGGVLPLHAAEDTEPAIVEAIHKARQAGDRIVLIRHVSPLATGLFAANSPGSEIRPAILTAAGNAPVVIKQFADAFQETDLAAQLNGIDALLLCGMMTQNCVVFTAMSTDAQPFGVTVLEDLCAAPTEVVHRIALNALRSKLAVSKTEDIWA
ncbi:MAG: isochorismatase family protein [Castellaniella sp.]|uniref:cysteine hydrolase family protein n=1 Tax=Castellaniella sp. TaxID=1955812 RepID=UPI003C784092